MAHLDSYLTALAKHAPRVSPSRSGAARIKRDAQRPGTKNLDAERKPLPTRTVLGARVRVGKDERAAQEEQCR